MNVKVLAAGGGGPQSSAPAAALAALRDPAAPCTWIHASASEEIFAALESFGLSDVAIRSLRSGPPERPRVEDYSDHAYVSLFAASTPTLIDDSVGAAVENKTEVEVEPEVGAEDRSSAPPDYLPPLQDIRAFLGANWLITVGEVDEADYLELCAHMERQVFARERGASFLLFFFLEWAVGTLYPVLDDLGDRVDDLEDLVVSEDRTVSMQTLFRLKRDLVELRRRVAPLRDLMQRLDSLEVSLVDRAVEVYFRDLHDDVLRVIELLDTYRDILSSALDLHLTTVNNRLSEIMKRLTVVATIFMPLTFITGFFGMNFRRLPFEDIAWFTSAVLLMIVIPVAMFAYFRRKEWW
ncbi:MAG: hypothetical protein GX536_04670 [Actinobacteria bacterium]|nr:hypothetical protein [Actinomycetota bacterium]